MRKYVVVSVVTLLLSLTAYAGVVGAPAQSVEWLQGPSTNLQSDLSSEQKAHPIVTDDWLSTGSQSITRIVWTRSDPTPGDEHDYLADSRPAGTTGLVLNISRDATEIPSASLSGSEDAQQSYRADSFNTAVYGTTQCESDVAQYSVDIPRDHGFDQGSYTVSSLSIEVALQNPSEQWEWDESVDRCVDATIRNLNNPLYALNDDLYSNNMGFGLSTVPEPGSLATLAVGVLGTAGWVVRFRRRNR